MLIARIAWACEIGKEVDQHGVEIVPPSFDYKEGITSEPKHFPFRLTARSQARLDIVDRDLEILMAEDPLNDR